MTSEEDGRSMLGAVLFPKLSDLWMAGYGCDVTIVCQDGTLNAPSLLLSTISDKIHDVLLVSKDKVLTFTNVDIQFWEDLLAWVYLGVLPGHLQDQTLLPKLCSTLLVAHSLGMKDVLQLYKHLSQIGKLGTLGSDIWKAFDPDVGLEVQVEYVSSVDESVTQMTFLGAVLNDLKDYLQSPPIKNIKIHRKNHKSLGIEICRVCNQSCLAALVQCIYCREIVNKDEGMAHMENKHFFCKSGIWPFTCNINYDVNQLVVKGGKALSRKFFKKPVSQYACILCRFCTEDVVDFIDHFPAHGFFPQICPHCGDVFSDEQIKAEHIEFCQIETLTNDDEAENIETDEEQDLLKDFDDGDNSSIDLADFSQIGYDYDITATVRKAEKGIPKKCLICRSNCTAKRVVCLYCNHVVKNEESHMKNEHGESKKAKVWFVTCQLNMDEDTKEIAKKITKQHGETVYECNICTQKFANKERVFFHVKTAHKIYSLFHCGHCNSGFKTPESRSTHEHICGGGSLVKCRKCNFYGSRENLRVHKMQVHDNSGARRKIVAGNQDSEEGTGRKCFSCQTNCRAMRVKCVYCFKVVDNDPSHMMLAHPYTPKTSPWVYSCNFLNRKVGQKEWMLFVKEPQSPNSETPQHRCLKCNKTTKTLDDMKKHIKKSHQRYMKICKYCETGFTSFVHHKDHEHFCGGGGLIACNICDKNVGCYRSLFDHMGKHHSEVEKITGKVKGGSQELREDSEGESADETTEHGEVMDTEIIDDEYDEQDHEVLEDPDPVDFFSDELSSQMFCLSTGKRCPARNIRCVYCCQEIDNDVSHLQNCPATPADATKLIHVCKVKPEDWVVSVKEPVDEDDENDFMDSKNKQHQFRCVQCHTVFTNLKGVTNHLSDEHQITVKVCKICDTGFGKHEMMADHFHFCSGNNLLCCKICDKECGSDRLYKKHVTAAHSGTCQEEEPPREENMETVDDSNHEFLSPLYNFTKSERKCICFKCGDHCKSSFVKCMLCHKFVENNTCHMDTEHAFTPKTSSWVYSCETSEDSQNWMASFKEQTLFVGKGRENQMTTQHRCCYCNECFPDLSGMLGHIKIDHGISHPVKVCDICEAVFLKFSYWKDHYHFCSGGSLLMCDTCGKELGGYRALANHECPKLPKKMKQSKSFYDTEEEQAALSDGEDGSHIIKLEALEKESDDENDENLETAQMEDMFIEEKTAQDVDNPKRCFTCGDQCQAKMVECMLCNEVVLGSDNHMMKIHSSMPSNIIWPVNCTYLSGETTSPVVTDMFFRETENGESMDLKVYRCLLCNEYCDTSVELSEHTKISHNFSVKFCKVCDAGFKNVIKRNSHQHFCSGGDLLKCSLCDALVGNWISASAHYNQVHKADQAEENSKKRKATTEGSPRKKYKMAEDPSKKSPLKTPSGNVGHRADASPLQELEIPKGTVLQCLMCKYKTPSIFEINSHNEKHHGYKSIELGQICHFCFKLFKSRSEREKHEQHEHLNDQRVFCEWCGRDFEIPLQKEIHYKYFHKSAQS